MTRNVKNQKTQKTWNFILLDLDTPGKWKLAY